MSSRQDILDTLKTDLEKIKIANGYEFEPTVVNHGITSFDDHESKPVVSFFMFSDEIQDEELGTESRLRIMSVLIYGYDDIDNGDYSRFFDFINDIEKFINSTDWTYQTSTMMGNLNLTVSPDNSKAMWDFSIKIYYNQDV